MLIDTRLAERLKNIKPSSTLAITSKAKRLKSEGQDIITLAAGEPDFDTPDFIKDAAISAIKAGFTKYTPTTGTPELKAAICEKLKNDNSLEYLPNQIVVSCGAKHSIFNALFALINKLDEVLIPSPYWVSYPEMVRLCEGRPVFLKTSPEGNFKITLKELESHLTLKTKLLILNSPSNPTGAVYTQEELKGIAAVCAKKKIFVLSDEIYEKIIYDGLKHTSIASLNKKIYDLTITVNGLSKSYSMTGWRIGYMAAPAYIADSVSKVQDHSTSNPNSIAQKAAVSALEAGEVFITDMRGAFQKRRDYIVKRLGGIKKLNLFVPQGAFYVFCAISKTRLDSATFANRLLDEAGVAIIPGGPFGWNDYVRISFCARMEQLEEGMNRLQEWVSKL